MSPTVMRVAASKSGVPTLYVGDRLLHSAYDPVKEARREVEALLSDNPALVVILGMGLGYSIDAVLDLLPNAKVLVIEADPAIHGIASDVRRLTTDPRVTYVLGRNADANFIAMTHCIGTGAASSMRYLTRLADMDTEHYADAVALIGRIAAMQIEGVMTTAAFGFLWWENSVRNYRQWLTLPDVASWFGSRRGKPIFIFAAGPSMMDDLDLFRGHEGGIRFAVDTAYPTLCKLGIRVDAVFAIDAQQATLEHFRAHRPERLVGAPVVPPALWRMTDLGVLTSLGGAHFEWFDHALGRTVAKLKSGGSVTTFAFDLARKMGADPIVLIGADFAHRKGQTHVRGTAYEARALEAMNRFQGIERLNGGNATSESHLRTETNLLQYAQWMKWEINETSSKTYRMTDYGLLDETPVIGRGMLEDLLRESRPSLPAFQAADRDEARLMKAFRKELRSLDEALADVAKLSGLSGFFDPIIRPYALVSMRENLEGALLDRVLRELGNAREVLVEIVG